MFAASWALLAVGLLAAAQTDFTIAFLLVWATGVMGKPFASGNGTGREI